MPGELARPRSVDYDDGSIMAWPPVFFLNPSGIKLHVVTYGPEGNDAQRAAQKLAIEVNATWDTYESRIIKPTPEECRKDWQ